MRIRVEIGTETVRKLVLDHIAEQLGALHPDPKLVKIEVRSKQNYRNHEWETGEFRAVYEGGDSQ